MCLLKRNIEKIRPHLHQCVTVKFQTIPGTAQAGVDYSVTSSDVILLEGETYKALPIEILNDRVPEPEETFRVRLLDQITGSAVLGAPIEATITIAPSDDPNGNFGGTTLTPFFCQWVHFD